MNTDNYENLIPFYNDIYLTQPGKWTFPIKRDEDAISKMLGYIPKPESVLDFGCGNGHTLAIFHGVCPKAKYTGVDLSDIALRLARVAVPDGEFYQDLPLNRTWDLILLMGVAEHFTRPVEQLREIGERLNPGGYMYLEVPTCRLDVDENGEGFRKTRIGIGQMEWHWKRETWDNAIKDAGLEIVENISKTDDGFTFLYVVKKGTG